MKISFASCWVHLKIYAIQSYHLKENLEKINKNSIKLVTSNCSCHNTSVTALVTSPFKYKHMMLGKVDNYVRLPHIRNREGSSICHRLCRFYRSLSEPWRGHQYVNIIAKSDCDIAHIHQSGQAFDENIIAHFLKNLKNKKKVVTIHNLSTQQWQNPSLNLAYNHADAIIVNNHHFKDVLAKAGVEETKIHVIPYGAVLKTLNGHQRQGLIMFAGSPLIGVKGFEYLASALHLLKDENIVIPLKLHGFHMRGHKEWANDIIRKEDIQDQTKWLSINNEDELIGAYQQSMACAVPYTGYSGSFPVSMALSNAVPVIASDVLGISENIDGAGLVFKSGSVEELAGALKKVFSDENLRSRMGKQGRATAEKLFSWPTVAEQTLAVYKQILNN